MKVFLTEALDYDSLSKSQRKNYDKLKKKYVDSHQMSQEQFDEIFYMGIGGTGQFVTWMLKNKDKFNRTDPKWEVLVDWATKENEITSGSSSAYANMQKLTPEELYQAVDIFQEGSVGNLELTRWILAHWNEVYDRTQANPFIKIAGVIDWFSNEAHSYDATLGIGKKTVDKVLEAEQNWHNGLSSNLDDDKRHIPTTKYTEDEPEGEILIEYNGGKMYWVDLKKNSCQLEGGAMGHCGTTRGETLYSLRERTAAGIKPHVTIAGSEQGKIWHQCKGVANKKPEPKYHDYIIDFFAKEIPGKKVKTVEFQEEFNPAMDFSPFDLTYQQYKEFESKDKEFIQNYLSKFGWRSSTTMWIRHIDQGQGNDITPITDEEGNPKTVLELYEMSVEDMAEKSNIDSATVDSNQNVIFPAEHDIVFNEADPDYDQRELADIEVFQVNNGTVTIPYDVFARYMKYYSQFLTEMDLKFIIERIAYAYVD